MHCCTQAGDLLAYGVHGRDWSWLRVPHCQLSPHQSCSYPQGSTAGSPKKEESQKEVLESARVFSQPWLSGHPTERGEEGPTRWDGAGGREHMILPGSCSPVAHAGNTCGD